MPLIYITGPSGAGKSTIRNELVKRGYEAHDTDEDGISAWYNNESDEPVERPRETERTPDWYEKHAYRMSPQRVHQLVDLANTKLIFLCGIPANDKDFIDDYDRVICLVIDEDVMKHRVATRTTNNFGKSPDELKLMLYWHGKMLERYKSWGATMIDATQPINDVVVAILKAVTDLA